MRPQWIVVRRQRAGWPGAPLAIAGVLGLLFLSTVVCRLWAAPSDAEKIGEHRYRIGRLVVDTEPRSVRVPARVNMRRGVIEYLAVAAEGKLHESVLQVEAEPVHLHVALLLLGLEPERSGQWGAPPRVPPGGRVDGGRGSGQSNGGIALPASPLNGGRGGPGGEEKGLPAGSGVEVWVEWRDGGRARRARLEELAWDIPAKRPMPAVVWTFTGASVGGKGPARAEQRSVVATYRDPDAVLNNPLPTAADDTVYKANERLIPAVGTPMTLVLRPGGDTAQHGAPETRREGTARADEP
jgi:hypothetical protein